MIQSKNVTGIEKNKIQQYKLMLLRIVYIILVLGVVFFLSFTLHT